ncbi:hypothetical protein OF83DRAFT_1044293, partial [Amylostereum chailletii]
MPSRGARDAPTFDPRDPRTLSSFLEDLEYLFVSAHITEDAEKKQHATRLAPISETGCWRGLPEFRHQDGDPTPEATWAEFKKVVYKEYTGSEGDRLYTMANLYKITGESAHVGIRSFVQFSEYNQLFKDVTKYLLETDQIQEKEQDHAFLQGFPDDLKNRILEDLRIMHPRQRQSIPYTVDQITESARHLLDGSPSYLASDTSPAPRATPRFSTSHSPQPAVKSEPIDSLLASVEALTKLMTADIQTRHQQPQVQQMSNQPIPQAPRLSGFTAGKCLYCSEGHFIQECPYIVTDASAGLIKKNERAQVVLANGMYVPKTIVGPDLRSRIQEWYRQNPSASPSQQPQLMLEV